MDSGRHVHITVPHAQYLPADRLAVPVAHRRATRTTNLLERREERRRAKTIPHAFGERAVLKLMYAAIRRASQTWQRVAISDFERQQLITLREQLNREFDAKHSHATHPAHEFTAEMGLDRIRS